MNTDTTQERAYTPSDVASLLEIGDSTLRKWCLALERAGYNFPRDDKSNRAYTEHDIIALKSFKEMTAGRKVSIDTASAIVSEKYKRGAGAVVPTVMNTVTNENGDTLQNLEHSERSQERHDEIMARFFVMEEEMRELKEYMKKQGEHILQQDQSIKRLIATIESMQQSEQLLLQEVKEAKEQVAAASQKKWFEFWK